MGEGKTVGEKLTELRNEGLENAFNRYYSTYAGCVVDNADPQQQGRATVTVKGLGFPTVLPRFSYPVSPYAGENFGFYFPPHADSPVWVTFDHGDVNVARITGSWWPNKDKSQDPRSPTKSHVPAEFVRGDGTAPTARGIKIKEGHGLIFEGDPETSHVELWTGENQEVGTSAKRHHRMKLDDANESIVISTFGTGDDDAAYEERDHHELLMDDTEKTRMVRLKTIGKSTALFHQLLMEESADNKKILLRSTESHYLEIDDKNENSKWSTKAEPGQTGFEWLLDKKNQFIRGITPGKRELIMDDNNSFIRLGDETHRIVQDTSGTLIEDSSGTQIEVSGDGDLSMQFASGSADTNIGQDNTVVVGGNQTETIAGTLDVTITGGWFKRVTGAAQMLFASTLSIQSTAVTVQAASFTVQSAQVSLGTGVLTTLVKAPFLAKYTIHQHTTTIAGANTGPPIVGTVDSGDTTIATTAA